MLMQTLSESFRTRRLPLRQWSCNSTPNSKRNFPRQKMEPPVCRRLNFAKANVLFRLIHCDSATLALRSLFGFGFLDSQSLVHPVIGSFQILGAGARIVALDVGLFARTSGSYKPWHRRNPDEVERPCSGSRCLPELPGHSSPSTLRRPSSDLVARAQVLLRFHARLGTFLHAG